MADKVLVDRASKTKRVSLFVENSPITRQSNLLNATTVNEMRILSLWQSYLQIAWVSACRLATAVAAMFDRKKLMVYHFMCVGSTKNNSIARKVVSKTVINCGCAFWYIYWSKSHTRKYILKQIVDPIWFIWGVGPCELWTCEYLQVSNIYYVVHVYFFVCSDIARIYVNIYKF